MIYFSQGFNTYIMCPNNRKIIATNGSLATVTGLGDIKVTPSNVLKSSANLIST